MKSVISIVVVLLAVSIAIGSGMISGQEANNPQEESLKPKRQLVWQKLDSNLDSEGKVWRTKVPGGWLVTMERFKQTVGRQGQSGAGIGIGMTFIPDPKHDWDGNSLN